MPLSPAQAAMRRTGLGASDMPAVVGESPWEGPLDIWAEKTGRAPPRVVTDAMDFGSAMEPGILSLYSDRVAPAVACGHETLRHPTVKIALATLDGRVVGEPRAVELKAVTPRGMRHWGPDCNEIPSWYVLQQSWQMYVADLPECDMAACFALEDFRSSHNEPSFRVKRDDELIGMLLEEAQRFWRYVETDTPPPVEFGSKRAGQILAAKWPRALRATLEPWTLETFELAREIHTARKAARTADALAEALGVKLKAKIAEGLGFGDDQQSVMWRADRSGRPNWKAIAQELNPTLALIAKHTGLPDRKLIIDGFDDIE